MELLFNDEHEILLTNVLMETTNEFHDYETRRFNAVFKMALQYSLLAAEPNQFVLPIATYFFKIQAN